MSFYRQPKTFFSAAALLFLTVFLFWPETTLAGCCVITAGWTTTPTCKDDFSAATCDSLKVGSVQPRYAGDNNPCSTIVDCVQYKAPATGKAEEEEAVPFKEIKPRLQVPIPTVKFSDITIKGGKLIVPFLVDYIAGVYKFLTGLAGLLATVLIMWGGIKWIIAGGDSGKIGEAKKTISAALIGLLIALGSYVILYTLNPKLVNFEGLKISLIERQPLIIEHEDESVAGQPPSDLVAISGDNIIGGGQANTTIADAVKKAAAALKTQGYQLRVTSAYRSEDVQKKLINEHCNNPPGSASCDPKPGKPQTCMLTDGPKSCPHTTGRAVDAWGGNAQCIEQPACLTDLNACRANPCQAAVIAAFRAEGFCNLSIEPWHFEKPTMSRGCN